MVSEGSQRHLGGVAGMLVQVRREGPTRPSEVEVGEFYLVRGTDSSGGRIPDQLIHVRGVPREAPFLSRASMVCEAWVFVDVGGVKLDWHEADFPLDAVNCREHGDHDRHLERVELDAGNRWHRAIYRRCNEHLKPGLGCRINQEVVL